MRKLFIAVLSLVVMLSTFVGCSTKKNDSDKPIIMTTLFPQYDFARQIAGDKANVQLLLPTGVESHSFDPSAADIVNISKADLFVYTGAEMEPWAEHIIESIDDKDVKIVDASKNITMLKGHDHDHEEEHEHDVHEHHHEYDPHIWTDPSNAKIMVDNILNALCEVDEENKDYYKEKAESYKEELTSLDNDFEKLVDSSKHTELFFGGRFALAYFAHRYDIDYTAAYDSCSTETEPSAKVVAEIITQMKEKDINVIYYEELVDPKVANTIADETGAKALLLHSCHNVTSDEMDKGVTYISLMKQNLENLREGLN